MRNFFLIKHHPRGLTEAYQENSRRTRAPRHTLPACAGRYDDEGVISLRQRVVNGMQSEGRVVSHLTEVSETSLYYYQNASLLFGCKRCALPATRSRGEARAEQLSWLSRVPGIFF